MQGCPVPWNAVYWCQWTKQSLMKWTNHLWLKRIWTVLILITARNGKNACFLTGAVNAKYRSGSLKRLLGLDSNGTNFIANLEQKNLDNKENRMTQWLLLGHFSVIPLRRQRILFMWLASQKYDRMNVVGPLVPFDCITNYNGHLFDCITNDSGHLSPW